MSILLVIILLVVLGMAAFMYIKNNREPSYIGVHNGQLAPLPASPNAVSSQTTDAERRVETLPTLGSLEQTKAAIEQTLKQIGDNEILSSKGEYMHILFSTPTMHYHDDVELLIQQDTGLIQYRSQSRTGYSDMGANRARYDRFKALYTAIAQPATD